ncbi:MAG TPA: 50S ribosomal protein L5 [Patescibacteria group bacterium]|nr:50S ribosomal protein L5 [Patescibacteria group bacterium]
MATATVQAKKKSISVPRLKQRYNDIVTKELKTEFKLANVNQVPKMDKIVVSSGLGRAKDDKRLMETATNTLSKVTGQHPIQTAAKKSVASFKLREGNKIGLKVTLRGDMMYEFYDRLVNLVLPRLRDFHGVSKKSFDHQGNYNIGLTDQSVFSELSFEETNPAHGIQISIIISSANIEQSKALLEKLGLPFEKEEK